jgi:hypothetical protein
MINDRGSAFHDCSFLKEQPCGRISPMVGHYVATPESLKNYTCFPSRVK